MIVLKGKARQLQANTELEGREIRTQARDYHSASLSPSTDIWQAKKSSGEMGASKYGRVVVEERGNKDGRETKK
ncbi:hypothetical protein E2C01_082344 [Portunus trituberculatus]|uniref:Uncharacterized protein n=1 Tax=Portunus trituberculatus TaxID=210409 RepID=A0A5B7IUA8_PORTR|nr:hypothetical protein [Portunus trituberculatus]